ncbi:MAG: Bifunctional DNA primase/polymerase [Candidatus Uhrbacteria bacterium GW2011_GWF2_39_13]|uniref:Bifunctional DNA primase/polymerase n=1 Tax=Candidatus Uhrbacteria bacterium GW2011_GWF2_39_13 TaxID=1618995 RepID=A0A0G0MUL9_9BACT|nr:MAG: Bifunctional DNA primase/polymerase [Candidatus Uhrbacteria bacterium GW2011_GWF2_39_13]HAU66001.1 hypothetical protein [Candidatus Uhrbacteria bacterium]
MSDNQNLTQALEYIKLGWNVFPLGYKSKRPDGNALIHTGHKKFDEFKQIEKGSWQCFQTEMVDEDLIKKWWEYSPISNIAIITGMTSKLIVIDIDPRNGGDESMKKLHLPPTYIVKTGGGGWHYYYAWNFSRPAPNIDYLPGIEIKGNGGYIVAPPSIHDKTFKSYEAINDPSEITETPEWLCEIETTNKEQLWKMGLETVPDGIRNKTAASVCGKIFSVLPPIFWNIIGWGGLKEWNQRNNKPPLPEKELRATFESIYKRAKGNNRLTRYRT